MYKKLEKIAFSISGNFRFRYKNQGFFSRILSVFKRNSGENKEFCLNLEYGSAHNKLKIHQGLVAILGESGSGKSTFMSILSGFERLSNEQRRQIEYFPEGDNAITYDSKTFDQIKKINFGYIFQRCYESKPLSVFENIALPLFIRKHSRKSVEKYSRQLMESLGLEDFSDYPANQLSGGELTRVGSLRGIAQTSKVVFADEPANNLDPQNATLIMQILKQWVQTTSNRTAIIVTHHREHAYKYADQIIIFQSDQKGGKKEGKIVLNLLKSGKDWSSAQKNEVSEALKGGIILKPFPSAPPEQKPRLYEYWDYFKFITRIAWNNIASKADGSRAISIITLTAFIALLFCVFLGNRALTWFSTVDQIKNNDAYLGSFEISVSHPPGLSEEVQTAIQGLTVERVQDWLQDRISTQIDKLHKISLSNNFFSPSEYFKLKGYKKLIDYNLNNIIVLSAIYETNQNGDILEAFQRYSHYLSNEIKASALSEKKSAKQLKYAEKSVRGIIREFDFLNDMPTKDTKMKIARIFPRWDSAPEFVKKNGMRMNKTTTIRWLDYCDPLFDDSRLKYIVNPDFRFQSNQDEGIIIDKETLVDELGYSLQEKEVKVLYGNGERACIPVKAVVERIPVANKHALTTFGFGEKIRSATHHCRENTKYYQCSLSVRSLEAFKTAWQNFNQEDNKDLYGNILTDCNIKSDKSIEFYCDYKYAKTMAEWKQWAERNLSMKVIDSDFIFKQKWEVPEMRDRAPPFSQGTVYASSKEVVRALGEFLSLAYQADQDKQWIISVSDYEKKINFAKQSEAILSKIKHFGTAILGGLFLLFLITNLSINIRNKATEIAIFRAMGGTVLSLLYIFNLQIIILLIISAFIAFVLATLGTLIARPIFIEKIIHVLWSNIDEQAEAVAALTQEGLLDNFISLLSLNSSIVLFSVICIVVSVTLSILYVRISPNYAISRILKER